jgi:hypothetical protein
MGLGNVTKAIWTLLQGTTNPNVAALYNNLYQRLEGAKSGVGGTVCSIGNVFYVDPVGGSDANNGLTPATAFATTAFALTQCVANNGDVIIRMPGGEYIDDNVPGAAEIAMNVAGVSLIGLNAFAPDMPESFAYYGRYGAGGWGAGTAAGPVFVVTEPCTIIGILAVCDAAYALLPHNGSAIQLNGQAGFGYGSYNYIAKCRFVNWGVAAVGIDIYGASYNWIEDCVFEGLVTAGIYVDAQVHNSTYNTIKRNIFRSGGSGITLRGGTHDNDFIENFFGRGLVAASGIIGTGGAAGNCFGNKFALSEAGGVGGAYDAVLAARQAAGFFCAGNWYIDIPAGLATATDPTS